MNSQEQKTAIKADAFYVIADLQKADAVLETASHLSADALEGLFETIKRFSDWFNNGEVLAVDDVSALGARDLVVGFKLSDRGRELLAALTAWDRHRNVDV